MLKVCHILSGDLWAGAEVMAFRLLKELKDYPEIDLFVVLLNDGRLAEELRAVGLTVYIIDEKSNSIFKIFYKLHEIIIEEKPNIIHSHRYKENIISFISSITYKSIKLISTQHGLPELYNKKKLSYNSIISKINFYLLSRFFYRVVAVSWDVKSCLIELLGFKNIRIDTIHNGTSIPPVNHHQISKFQFLIGSSGRLFPVKNFPLLVQIASILKNDEGIGFRLAGDGPGKPDLEKNIRQYKLEKMFSLAGHLDAMDTFYENLDLYVNTSKHEGIPMAILEAMSYGIPIVAPRIGGIPEIIEDGKEGFLIDTRDPIAFAEKCKLLHHDRDLWKKMSIAAREKVVKKFSQSRMACQYLSLYQKSI